MLFIIIGIGLWMAVHFSPSLAPALRAGAIHKLGEKGYKACFALVVLVALISMVVGWRATPIEHLYTPHPALRHLSMLLMLIAFILFGSAKAPVRIRSYVRHPQLISVMLWALAHLLANGETRSVLLFSGMGTWAFMQMHLLNRRDGVWLKPSVAGWQRELKVLLISIVVMLVVVSLHGWFTGVRLF